MTFRVRSSIPPSFQFPLWRANGNREEELPFISGEKWAIVRCKAIKKRWLASVAAPFSLCPRFAFTLGDFRVSIFEFRLPIFEQKGKRTLGRAAFASARPSNKSGEWQVASNSPTLWSAGACSRFKSGGKPPQSKGAGPSARSCPRCTLNLSALRITLQRSKLTVNGEKHCLCLKSRSLRPSPN